MNHKKAAGLGVRTVAMRTLLGSVWCCLVLLCGSPALAASADCGSYRLAFYEHGALYYQGDDGRHVGIDLDVVNEIARRSGCRFDTVLESRVRIWEQLKHRVIDLSTSGVATPERLAYLEFYPYIDARNFVLMRRDQTVSIGTPETFLADRTRRVVVVKGFKHGHTLDAWLDQLRKQQRVVEVGDIEAVLRAFRGGRADAMLATPLTWGLMARRDGGLKDFKLLDWAPQDRVTGGLIVSRATVSEPDKQRLREAIASMRRDGALDAIFRRHVGDEMAATLRYEGP